MQRSPSKSKRIRRDPSAAFFNSIPTSEAEEDEMSEPTNANPRRRCHSTHTLPDRAIEPNFLAADDLVKCPICTRRVKYKSINQHMDQGCKDPPPNSGRPTSTTSDWKKLLGGPSKGKQKDTSDDTDDDRLPKASYATLKDKKLKEMLVEQGLPTTGDRNQWVMIFNANLDKSAKHRKGKVELKKELRKWEDEKAKKRKATVEDTIAHEVRISLSSSSSHISKLTRNERVQKRHKDEFAQLVNAARPRGDKDKASSKSARSLLAERSNSDVVIPLSGDKAKSQGATQVHAGGEPEEGVIVVDSEEERELVLPTRTD
ncbi:hypothetical protein DXG03_001155 [Asterophora parasitica]|uniref:UBZ4-type domain-containing protein n=1 Tax=Asterophora parasitica TaxID=117018 RepID=A0A9P7GC75_9AGAR|nr:hypothetical protein DXG03_001155 [Asterophora parasitica]